MSPPRFKFDRDASAADDADGASAPEQTLQQAIAQLREIKAYARHFVEAKLDSARLSIRKAVVWTALGLLGAVAGGTILVTAAVLVTVGAAEGVAALLGGRMWAGNLIIGTLILAGVALGAWMMARRIMNSSRQETMERYERKLQRQRIELDGADIQQRSREFAEGAQ